MLEEVPTKGPGFRDVPRRSVVTGASGFAGRRLVEMLIERGAENVIAFDIEPAPTDALRHPGVTYVQGDITKPVDVSAACEGADCCFHLAALVGPYHERAAYEGVNVQGTLNVLDACRKHHVPKLVLSSSPSTRFPYPDPNVRGLSEDDLERINGDGKYSPTFHAEYARTKAHGEAAVLEACSDELMTIAVAPHQLYGPRDPLLFPSLLEAASSGRLRVFGTGKNRVSFTHVDNYCHALILGAEALRPGSVALGRFYVVTDPDSVLLWDAFDKAVVGVGLASIKSRRAIPLPVMLVAASLTVGVARIMSKITGRPFSALMRRLKLTPFSVRMLAIDRWFNIARAEQELEYKPLYAFADGWAQTIEWFRAHRGSA